MNSLRDANEFFDPESASTSGLSHVYSQPMSIPSPRGMISRDSCLQPDTPISLGTSGHVFEGLPAPDELSSTFSEKSKNLASSCRLNPVVLAKSGTRRRIEKRTAESYSTNSSLCQEVFDLGSSTSYRRNLSSKLYDGKSGESDLGLAFRQIP